MPGFGDQAAKLGSSAQLFVILANLFPSFASIVNKNLGSDILGMSVFIIGVVVSIWIQLTNHVIIRSEEWLISHDPITGKSKLGDHIVIHFRPHHAILVGFLTYFLFLLSSNAIAIPRIKQLIDFKYLCKREEIANDQHTGMCIVDKIKLNVTRYWIMANSGSPQFMMASSPLSYAYGIICLYNLVSHMYLVAKYIHWRYLLLDDESNYKWSTVFMFIVDTTVVVLGSIAPICRCFMALRSKSPNNLVEFKVEKYWTQMLRDWKERRLPFPSCPRRLSRHAHYLQAILLNICISLQNIVVVSCKMFGLIGIVLSMPVKFCLYCWKSLKAWLCTTPLASSSDATNEDLNNYVLHTEDNMELS